MEIRKITIPTFRENQVNKVYVNGQETDEIKPYADIIKENMAGAIDAALNAFGDEEIMMFVCVRQKNVDTSLMCVCATPFIAGQEVEVSIPNIDMPKVTFVKTEK